MSTSRRRMLIIVLLLITGLGLHVGAAEATRDTDDTRPCPSADERTYLNDSAPLSDAFASGMSRFGDDPYNRMLIRTELPILQQAHDDLSQLDPPATLEAVHELSLFGYSTMIAALKDASAGDFETATIRLDIGSELAIRATELLDNHC